MAPPLSQALNFMDSGCRSTDHNCRNPTTCCICCNLHTIWLPSGTTLVSNHFWYCRFLSTLRGHHLSTFSSNLHISEFLRR